jgi:ribonuclease E
MMSRQQHYTPAKQSTAKRKVVISERDNIAALMEGDKAIEFIINRGEMLLGDVYLAQVENILPSIDAGFVNVGGDKMGFLHSSDVQGRGELKTRLKPRQRLIVQVMKEPTGHKGPRVTTNVSLPGRFLVLMPGSKGISVSRKIETQAERSRLKSICSLVKAPGMGVIIRTEAAGQTDTDILEDFEVLLERWQTIVSTADSAAPPALLYRDQDLIYRVVRELVTENVDELIIDTSFGHQRAQQLLQNWNLDKTITVQQYSGTQSIMVAKGVEREIRQALQTKVPLPSGGYLYIQPTEALTVVDVNSGRFTSLSSQADTIRITNLEACREIARQLRLRNIGGMVVADFIDMESRADQLAVLQAFENELAPDKAKPQVGQLTDLGLVEMTRHRQGQALSEIFGSSCKNCNGSGQAAIEFNWTSTSADVPDYRSGARRGSSSGGGSRNAGRSNGNTRNGGDSERNSTDRGGKGGRNNKPDSRSNDRPTSTDAPSLEQDARQPKPREQREEKLQTVVSEGEQATKKPSGRGRRDYTPAPEPGQVLLSSPLPNEANTDYAEIIQEKSLAVLNANFANATPLGYPPRGAHQNLMRYSAKSTNFLTLLNNFTRRQNSRADRQGEGAYDEENLIAEQESQALQQGQDVEHNTPMAEADSTPQAPEPVLEKPSPQTITPVSEEPATPAAKPIMLGKLAEQLSNRQQSLEASVSSSQQEPVQVPLPVNAKKEASPSVSVVENVVLPFVDALHNAENDSRRKEVSRQFLVDVSRLTPAERVLDEAATEQLPHLTLEYLGIPEVPLPFDEEAPHALLEQLVEVAENVAAIQVKPQPVEEAPFSPVVTDAPAASVDSPSDTHVELVVEEDSSEPAASSQEAHEAEDLDLDDEDDDEFEEDMSGGNLDEMIKRKRHALKKGGGKAKKRTTQNHKKKKK